MEVLDILDLLLVEEEEEEDVMVIMVVVVLLATEKAAAKADTISLSAMTAGETTSGEEPTRAGSVSPGTADEEEKVEVEVEDSAAGVNDPWTAARVQAARPRVLPSIFSLEF